MLCGFLCGGGDDPVTAWLAQVLPADAHAHAARDVLLDYAAPIERSFRSADLEIEISALDDSAPLIERATAIYDWIRGFLFAMGVLGVSESALSEDGREIYRDLTALTRMDLDALEESEDNEQALMEVTEFLRVAAMLIHEERCAARGES